MSWAAHIPADLSCCKICGVVMESRKGLHLHLKKHAVSIPDYYQDHYPKFNRATGEKMPFGTYVDKYFETDFDNRAQMINWCNTQPNEVVGPYILDVLKKRILEKSYSAAPSSSQLFLDSLPNLDIYARVFGSYDAACEKIGYKPIYSVSYEADKWKKDCSKSKIVIDTREQKPFKFANSKVMGLKVGDYTLASGPGSGTTYVDRKSPEDYKGTMTLGCERFEKEVVRAVDMGFYLFVVIEANLLTIEKENINSAHNYNMKYVFHNMKNLQNKYHKNLQFVFAKDRVKAQNLTQKLLTLGKYAWDKDVQYFVEKGGIS
jgi:hypothetical protein